MFQATKLGAEAKRSYNPWKSSIIILLPVYYSFNRKYKYSWVLSWFQLQKKKDKKSDFGPCVVFREVNNSHMLWVSSFRRLHIKQTVPVLCWAERPIMVHGLMLTGRAEALGRHYEKPQLKLQAAFGLGQDDKILKSSKHKKLAPCYILGCCGNWFQQLWYLLSERVTNCSLQMIP